MSLFDLEPRIRLDMIEDIGGSVGAGRSTRRSESRIERCIKKPPDFARRDSSITSRGKKPVREVTAIAQSLDSGR
jgi:hypothetical protein